MKWDWKFLPWRFLKPWSLLQGDIENENQVTLLVGNYKNHGQIHTRTDFRLPSFNFIFEGADTIKFF